ncbi:MAG TPA: hypothetical protein VKV27_12555 [Solirubrobacteraceae bacterium]|nr:hypothetical protein [Solirubrobacteraceae bacterium]
MSELSAGAAVAIEGVQWAPAGAGRLTITVTGRWRRRPAGSVAPALLVEAAGRRHRYPALPEPPGIAGAPPGAWRLRFSVPAAMAPELGRTWLVLAGSVIGLPPAIPAGDVSEPPGDQPPEAATAAESAAAEPVPAEATSAGPRPPVQAGPRPPVQAGPWPPVQAGSATAGSTAPSTVERRRLALERELRLAQERLRQRTASEPGTPRALPDAQLVAALRAELAQRVRAEAELRVRLAGVQARIAARLAIEQRVAEHHARLRSELDALARALAAERASRLDAQHRASRLAAQLTSARAAMREAQLGIAELRARLARLTQARPAAPIARDDSAESPVGPDEPGSAAQLDPDRLAGALRRLRGAIAPPPEAPAPAAPPGSATSAAAPESARPPSRRAATIEAAFRRLAARNARTAGALLLELLPLQAAAWRRPIAYDLVLGPRWCVHVTAAHGSTVVRPARAPRPASQAPTRVLGRPDQIARLLTAGRLRRLTGWGIARVRGEREAVRALGALLGLPLDLAGLHADGARLDGATALGLVAAAIEPGWTAGERFSLVCAQPGGRELALIVDDGRIPQVAAAESARHPVTVLRCRADQLPLLLSGAPVAGPEIQGDGRPLRLVRDWLARAGGA